MIGRALKIVGAFFAALLILAVLIFLAYTETRPERRILVEENYQPPQRPQTVQPTPTAALPESDNLTPMPGNSEASNMGDE